MNSTQQELSPSLEELYPGFFTGAYAVRIACLVIAPFGVLGNILSFMVAAKLGDHTSGTGFIRCLAVADTMALVQDGFIEMGLPVIGINIRAINSIVCKTLSWYSWFTTVWANWVIVGFSLDRFVAVKAPFFYRQHGKPRVAVVYSVVTLAISAALAAPASLVFDINTRVEDSCDPVDFSAISADNFMIYVAIYILGLYAAVPLLIIAVVNPTIAIMIRHQLISKAKMHSSGSLGANDDHKKVGRDVTRTLVAVSVVFFILTSTGGFLVFYVNYTVPNNPYEEALFFFLNTFKELAATFNNSVNFLLYVISGRIFRAEFYKLIGLRK